MSYYHHIIINSKPASIFCIYLKSWKQSVSSWGTYTKDSIISAMKDLPAILKVLTIQMGGTQIQSRPYTLVTAKTSTGHCVRPKAKWKWKCWSLTRVWLKPARLPCPWNSPGKNTEVGIIPFSKGPSRPKDGTQVFCIAGGFFTKAPCGKPVYLQSMPRLTFCIHPPRKRKANLNSFMAENGSACFICSVWIRIFKNGLKKSGGSLWKAF